jgi:hypothetical protein
MGILIFKGLTARRLYKSFGVKGLNIFRYHRTKNCVVIVASTLAGSVNSKSLLRGFAPSIHSTCHLSILQKPCTNKACSPYSSTVATRPFSFTNPYVLLK